MHCILLPANICFSFKICVFFTPCASCVDTSVQSMYIHWCTLSSMYIHWCTLLSMYIHWCTLWNYCSVLEAGPHYFGALQFSSNISQFMLDIINQSESDLARSPNPKWGSDRNRQLNSNHFEIRFFFTRYKLWFPGEFARQNVWSSNHDIWMYKTVWLFTLMKNRF